MAMSPFHRLNMFYTRRQIRVSKVLVHENFTDNVNDIALLRLGTVNYNCNQLRNESL